MAIQLHPPVFSEDTELSKKLDFSDFLIVFTKKQLVRLPPHAFRRREESGTLLSLLVFLHLLGDLHFAKLAFLLQVLD